MITLDSSLTQALMDLFVRLLAWPLNDFDFDFNWGTSMAYLLDLIKLLGCLSNLFLNMFSDGVLTTDSDWWFHEYIILNEKINFLKFVFGHMVNSGYHNKMSFKNIISFSNFWLKKTYNYLSQLLYYFYFENLSTLTQFNDTFWNLIQLVIAAIDFLQSFSPELISTGWKEANSVVGKV